MMLRTVDTGDVSYVYTPTEANDEIISAIPMHLGTSESLPDAVKLSDSYKALKSSPRFRSLAARNARIFNKNNYKDDDSYDFVVKRILEVLPGKKSRLFFGGDFTSADELHTVIKAAGDLKHVTWFIASFNQSLLNNYWLNTDVMLGEELPENVWLYDASGSKDCVLHTYPTLTYRGCAVEPLQELSQFPAEYKPYTIEVWMK